MCKSFKCLQRQKDIKNLEDAYHYSKVKMLYIKMKALEKMYENIFFLQ